MSVKAVSETKILPSQVSGYLVPTNTCDNPHYVEEVIKGSRFIGRTAFTQSVEEAKAFINHFNQTEPDATHHCWAYIVGNPNSTTLLACSDNGEPSGTAGMPMLNVLKHGNIGDITTVVTRYYGGTKLGTGGLARAYGGSVKLGLESLLITQRIYTTNISIEAPYEMLKQVEYLLKEHQASIFDTQFDQNIAIQAKVPQDQLENLLASFQPYQNKLIIKIDD